jgi:NitT/TauT family transport system substrate-binding protein
VLDRAFTELSFDIDPLAATFPQLAKDSVTAGSAEKETNLAGFVDVTPLNNVLTAAGKPTVDAAGLDKPGVTAMTSTIERRTPAGRAPR